MRCAFVSVATKVPFEAVVNRQKKMKSFYSLVVVCAIAISIAEARVTRKGDPTFLDDSLNVNFEDNNEYVFSFFKLFHRTHNFLQKT